MAFISCNPAREAATALRRRSQGPKTAEGRVLMAARRASRRPAKDEFRRPGISTNMSRPTRETSNRLWLDAIPNYRSPS